MKKGRLLNSELSYVIGKMGHTDSITIGDCGLPVPEGVQRIDLAVTKGLPELIPVLATVLDELFIEKVVLAQEIIESNPKLNDKIIEIIKDSENEEIRSINIEYVAHKEFKKLTAGTKAVVRTGEYKSYANIILVSGVTF